MKHILLILTAIITISVEGKQKRRKAQEPEIQYATPPGADELRESFREKADSKENEAKLENTKTVQKEQYPQLFDLGKPSVELMEYLGFENDNVAEIFFHILSKYLFDFELCRALCIEEH